MRTLKGDIRRRLMVGVGVALLAGLVVAPAVHAVGPTYAIGDVFAGVGNGQIMQFSPTGTLLNTLTGLPTTENTGMAFDAAGNLYGTGFSGNISKYDNSGNFLSSFGSGFTAHTESIVRDAAGNFYVGQATPGTPTVLKFDATGALLATYTPATEDRGTDWIDLAADQCTLFYTSEGVLVKRFNVCTNTQLPDFATLPSPTLFALRIRPNGDVMVAGTSAVYRLDSTGALVQTYTVPGTSYLFALNLDPDGTSFWTADLFSGKIARVDIASGTVVTTFNAPPNPSVAGLAVFGEITAATAAISLTPATATNPAGTDHTVTAHVTSGGSPLAGQVVTFSVTGQNAGATGTCVPASCATDASGNVTFTYHDTNGAGDDTITASFTDAAGALQSATAKKHWAAAQDPTITAAGVAVAATEGTAFSGTVATFTDPDTAALASEYGATIDWGDGTSSAGTISGSSGNFTVSGGHTYAEQGTYTVTTTITDTDNASNTSTATSTATVADALVTAGALTLSGGVEGVSATTASFSFSDANTAALATEYTATIHWGDTTSSAGTVSGSGGSFTVTGSHQYAEEGTYTVTVTATGDGTDSATATGTATVADAPLASACAMAAFTTQAFSGPTATFTDASTTGTLSDFSATINWGDSHTSAGTITGGPGTAPYTVKGSHTYTSTGFFTVTTTVTDVGSSTTTATCTKVLVFAFAPGGGSFAIGDKENKVGASVNFWGAQWAKNNPVSSGTVVSAFKGFTETPASPTCASTTWSTDPGNSTPPPAGPLPAYMGVIVTSSYSKSGPAISGNIVHIVVVKTDPGYAPNPGHPGTGKVVATVC